MPPELIPGVIRHALAKVGGALAGWPARYHVRLRELFNLLNGAVEHPFRDVRVEAVAGIPIPFVRQDGPEASSLEPERHSAASREQFNDARTIAFRFRFKHKCRWALPLLFSLERADTKSTWSNSLDADRVTRLDAVLSEELSDPCPPSEEATGSPRLGVGRDIREDIVSESHDMKLDGLAEAGLRRRSAVAIGGEEIGVPRDVEMALAKVRGGHANQSLPVTYPTAHD